MSGAREIRDKIKSIANTQKITRAMEMVAASKMKKAQHQMARSRPYAEKIIQVIRHLASGNTEYKHPYLEKRKINRVGYLIVSTDRGLCGGLNTNLFKMVLDEMQKQQSQGVEVELCLIGRKAESFFKRFKVEIVGIKTDLGTQPTAGDVIGVVKVMLDRFDEGKIDALYTIYNRFINTMSQKPVSEQLVPLKPEEENVTSSHTWDYIYEPDAKELLDTLLSRYMESLVYQSVVENIACEQAARMVAMKNASENAQELIREFQLIYNKARQATITKEISEIVGGAAAV